MAKTKQSRLTGELLEAASEMRSLGILSKPAHDKITKRHLDENSVVIKPIKAGEIKVLRERAHMSQAVFAHCLNLTAGYISQLERGSKKASGPALVLLNVIRRKGIEAIL